MKNPTSQKNDAELNPLPNVKSYGPIDNLNKYLAKMAETAEMNYPTLLKNVLRTEEERIAGSRSVEYGVKSYEKKVKKNENN